MSTKFKQGQEITYKGEKLTIKVATKNFSTNKISYLLSNDEMVSEAELEAKENVPVTPITVDPILLTTYEKLYDKQVPVNKKKDAEWIKQKIQEKEQEIAAKKVPETPYQSLEKLTKEELLALAVEKELEIDPEDYETAEELLIAVCQELEVEIPE